MVEAYPYNHAHLLVDMAIFPACDVLWHAILVFQMPIVVGSFFRVVGYQYLAFRRFCTKEDLRGLVPIQKCGLICNQCISEIVPYSLNSELQVVFGVSIVIIVGFVCRSWTSRISTFKLELVIVVFVLSWCCGLTSYTISGR